MEPATPARGAKRETVLTTILITDLVDSTKLTTRYGDSRAAEFFARNDRIARDLLDQFGGCEIDKTDGFLILFNRPIDAVLYSLAYHESLSQLSAELKVDLKARSGVHLGELVLIHNTAEDQARGVKPIEVEGLAKPQAARIMSLAQGGQTLLTRGAFDLARRGAIGADVLPERMVWMAHGPYLLKGVDEPVDVFEAGVEGRAPLVAPPDTDKVRRSVAAGDEETLGWRPAVGLPMPYRKGWVIDSKLGEGGFGEVWLAKNERTGARRVFKFCFDSERLRSLKRELTLFRLLRDALGERTDIARLYDVQLDESPFFLESEYSPWGSLVEWAEKQGGVGTVSLETRLDIVARTARAVGAAHSVGILHKDIKPANILIYPDNDGHPKPQLADFGIGSLTDESQLAKRNITMVGFTQALDAIEATTTPMYAPPEIMAGRAFTIHGDVYSLGVLLYQMVIGDLERPLASDWEKYVDDPLLREDIRDCVAGDEDARLNSAAALAERLETLDKRRRARVRRHVTRVSLMSAAILLVIMAVTTIVLLREIGLKNQIIQEETKRTRIGEFFSEGITRSDPGSQRYDVAAGLQVTVASMLDDLATRASTAFAEYPDLEARALVVLSRSYKNLALFNRAEITAQRALDVRKAMDAGDHPDLADAYLAVGDALWWQREFEQAMPYYESCLAIRQRLYLEHSAEVAEVLNNLAACQSSMRNYEVAELNYRKALEIRMALPPPFDQMLVAASQNNLAECLRGQGKYADAEALYLEALETARRVGGEDHIYVGRCLHNLGRFYAIRNRLPEAWKSFGDAIRVKSRAVGESNLSVAESEYLYARYLLENNLTDEAAKHIERAVAIQRADQNTPNEELADSLVMSGRIARQLGNEGSASADFTEAERLLLNDVDRRKEIRDLPIESITRTLDELIALSREWGSDGKVREYEAMKSQLLASRGNQ